MTPVRLPRPFRDKVFADAASIRASTAAARLTSLTSFDYNGGDLNKAFLASAFLITTLTSLANARDISGQVFIVTRGGQSVKLGLVKVTAYDADQVAAVVKDADEKTAAERSQLQRIEQAADAAYKRFSDSRGSDHGKWLGALNLEEKAQRRRAYLTSSFYYSKSFPPELANVKTDADGHFRISVLDGKPITVRAWSTRELSESVECYDWLVRVPDVTAEVNLSNDNQLNSSSAAALLGDKYTTEQIAAEAEKLANNISMRMTRSTPPAIAPSPPPAPPSPEFVTLRSPISIPVKYGSITLPAGTRLQVAQRLGTTVRVLYSGESYDIALSSVQ
jgi:hypothetical protein